MKDIFRMAALKKIGEEEWKKRSFINGTNEELGDGSSSRPGIVKFHKEQLQQQLNLGMTKSNFNYQSKLNTRQPSNRSILAPLCDNNINEEVNIKKSRFKTKSDESIDSLEILVNNNLEKKISSSKKITLNNPSELNNNFGNALKLDLKLSLFKN
jgi:hypothetical protein